MEMEQLLSMGFPEELAAEALAATGGKSIAEATEWILAHNSTPHSNPSPLQPNPHSNASQPRINRFFTSSTSQIEGEQAKDSEPPTKRLRLKLHEPLAERMRPRTIDDVFGQDHLLNTNSLLRSAIDRHRLPSVIFWGPPGTGKTSIARAIVNSFASTTSSYRFVPLSAVTCGVKDVRDAVDEARRMKKMNKRTVLFLDEVHRFNKSQQDSFLPVIEDGSIVFMGATTENPSFHIITPLLSRCRVLKLNPLLPQHVSIILERAINDIDKGVIPSIGGKVKVNDEAIDFLSSNCDGDARVALSALEASAITASARSMANISKTKEEISEDSKEGNGVPVIVTLDDVKEALQCKHVAYDKNGEEHYNMISALHKSMRGSDANAAIYWLARMLEGGEEPLYIARRMIRFASEDIGLADPFALPQAVACYQACHFIGVPECNVNLAQCVAYLAMAPKSVSVYRAIERAQKVVRESVGQNDGVPLHLRNAPTKLMKEFGYGKGYIYPPDNPSESQSYLPPSIQGLKFLDWPNG